jgi:hypothetical protein
LAVTNTRAGFRTRTLLALLALAGLSSACGGEERVSRSIGESVEKGPGTQLQIVNLLVDRQASKSGGGSGTGFVMKLTACKFRRHMNPPPSWSSGFT